MSSFSFIPCDVLVLEAQTSIFISFLSGPMSETLKRGCATPEYCQTYFNVRRGFVSRSIYCCSDDLCNVVPYNGKALKIPQKGKK